MEKSFVIYAPQNDKSGNPISAFTSRRHLGLRRARHPRARDHVADGQGRGHPALGRRPLPTDPAAQPLAVAEALPLALLPHRRARRGVPVRGAQPERRRRQQDGQG